MDELQYILLYQIKGLPFFKKALPNPLVPRLYGVTLWDCFSRFQKIPQRYIVRFQSYQNPAFSLLTMEARNKRQTIMQSLVSPLNP